MTKFTVGIPNYQLLARYLTLTLSVTLCWLTTTSAVCTEERWVPVAETDYETPLYPDVTDTNARPLGYKVGTYNYNKDETVCVKVHGTAGRHVEVKLETEPTNKICIRSTNDDSLNCASTKRYQQCKAFNSKNNSTSFEFYCTGECTESNVNFWYRFRVCPYTSYDANEQWCLNIGEDFPTSLLPQPPLPDSTTTKTIGQGTITSVSQALLATLAVGWSVIL